MTEQQSQLEPTTDSVPTAAVAVLAGASSANSAVSGPGRARRLRWSLAAIGAAVVIGASAIGFTALASAVSASAVLPWAPSDAVVYAEVRADMPGAQRANLLAFLSKFPGFADQTNFDAKADDGLDRLVSHLTDAKHNFSTEIKPWFSGQLGVSIESRDPSKPSMLVVVSVSNAAAATTWLASVTPANAVHDPMGGIDLVESAAAPGKVPFAYALDGSVLLAGSVDAVKLAIARGPTNALAADAGFKAARASLGGDELGSVYLDVKGYVALVSQAETSALSKLATGTGGMKFAMPAIPPIDTSLLPGWVALRVQADSDHLVFDEAQPTLAGQPAQASRTSAIAAELPAGTLAQVELHDVGSLAQRALGQLEKQPGGPTAAQVDGIFKYVGGVDKALGWLGDADVAIIHDGSGFSGGIVAQTTDATASTNLFTELRNLASLGGSTAGIAIRTESYDGQTITVVSAASAGTTSTPRVELAFSQANDLVVVGVGDAFVKAVLDTKAGHSLADQPAYQRAIGLAGSSNAGQGFIDLAALRTDIEALAPKSSRLADYDANIKPFLEPFASLAWSNSAGSDLSTTRVVLVLK